MLAMLIRLLVALLAAGSPPGAGSSPAKEAAQEREIDSADALLTELERADADLATLEADVIYDRVYEVQGDEQIRTGRLYFSSGVGAVGAVGGGGGGGGEGRRFAVYFERLQIGARVEERPLVYIFDGEWFVEKRPDERQFIKRQVVPPGEKFDPLKIGEGPFPIPIGQKREDILARYRAELLEAEAGLDRDDLREFVAGAYQLKLTPLDPRDTFREVRLWYFRAGVGGKLLPRMARTVNTEGDVSVVQLVGVKINSEMDASRLDTATPVAGWDVQIQPYRGAGG